VTSIPVYLEVGKKRVFAGAIEWPGWCRAGRDEQSATEALLAYGPRYREAVGRTRRGFKGPVDATTFDVVERLEGDATTDFGAPGKAPSADDRPLPDPELRRLAAILKACWTAFDEAAEVATGATLRKGPRGGGREFDAIVSHVLEADKAYLSRLGATFQSSKNEKVAQEMARLREAILGTLRARAHDQPLPPSRRTKPPWSPRYAIRRSAWHALDHAWEIEDRAMPSSDTG
jgi:hypothetical protein